MELGILIIGILAGILSGLFGIGGGIVMVPSLIAVFGMDMLQANATSLAAMLLPVGFLGVVAYYKAGYIQLKKALWISAGLLLGSFFGAEIAVSVDEKLLSKLYAAFLLYVSVSYLGIPGWLKKHVGSNSSKKNTLHHTKERLVWEFLLLGVTAGVFAGIFGKGGGLIIVPMLLNYFHFDAKSATATSLAALQLPVGLPSVIVYAQAGYMNWWYAGIMALGIVFGVFWGSKMAIKLPANTFKRIYAFFLLGVAVYMVFKYM